MAVVALVRANLAPASRPVAHFAAPAEAARTTTTAMTVAAALAAMPDSDAGHRVIADSPPDRMEVVGSRTIGM